MSQLTEQLIKKLGLQNEPKILKKTTELLRLLEVRSTNINATLNDYAKIVLCIDLAAMVLGILFEQDNALKIAGLRKPQYANNKRMFAKILDLNKLAGVNDICIKLGINEVAKKANELLELYKNSVENESTDIDITHPQYQAMAVYQACKISQRKISKLKILSFIHLRPSQWSQLEQRWDKIIATHIEIKEKKVKSRGNGEFEGENGSQNLAKIPKHPKLPVVEDYETWKGRMLQMSKIQLYAEKEKTKDDKENFIQI